MKTRHKLSETDILVGLMVAGTVALVYLCLWFAGVTPASRDEREFIVMLEQSHLSKRPHVAAVINAVHTSTYVSRRHFFAAEAAFNAEAKSQGKL